MYVSIRNINWFLLMLLVCLTLGSCERTTELNFDPQDAGNEDAAS
jgi:hypothetical protein